MIILEIPNEIKDESKATKKHTKKVDKPINCSTTLINANKIFESFANELKTLCNNWHEMFIHDLLIIFHDIGTVDLDMDILSAYLQPEVIPDLRVVFTFFKNQQHLRDISFGFNELVQRFKLSSDPNLQKVLSDLTKIVSETRIKTCYDEYQNYIENIEKKYSVDMLNLCAAFNLSNDLIQFLDDLTTTDADNLLEAVNDWDETMISTKSVIDFVKLKTFFTRIQTSIEQIRLNKNSEILFHDVANHFDDIFNDDDFKNINELFPTCLLALTGIKQLYLELTNKEQSKRKCIIDIMSNSILNFTKNLQSERLFDVEIKSKNLSFGDLSELRDRARLIEYSNTHKNNSEQNFEMNKLDSFVDLVSVIEDVLKNLSSLYTAGFPKVNEIIDKEIITCNNGNYDSLRYLYKNLEDRLDQWEHQLCRMYQVYPELTYFSYEQFQTIENFIYDLETNTEHPGYHLLKYIGFEPALIKNIELTPRSDNENQCLANLGEILKTQRSKSDDLEDIQEDNVMHIVSIYWYSFYRRLNAIIFRI